jgi:cobalt-zinc-cadmium efflux system membrane fusion protein
MKNTFSMKYIVFLIMIFTALLIQCTSEVQNSESNVDPEMSAKPDIIRLTSAQLKNAEIEVGEPVTRKVSTTIKLTGEIDVSPENKVFVSNPFGGFVRATKMLPGTRVKRGDLLVTMEDPGYIQMQQDYLMARSRLRFLELDYKRQQDLNSDKSISDKVFQQTTAEYTSQKILLRSLEEKLRLININSAALSEDNISRMVKIYAPMNGYVSAVYANVGKYSNSTDPLLELTDESALHASLTVFEKDLRHIAVGQRLKVKSPLRPDKEYLAEVHCINRSLTSDRTSEVHCDIENQDSDLFPGMFISADLAIAEAEVLAVQEDAVVSWDHQQFVFVANRKDEFQMTPIGTGMSSDGFVELQDNLKGKAVVTRNAYSLLMKLKNSDE